MLCRTCGGIIISNLAHLPVNWTLRETQVSVCSCFVCTDALVASAVQQREKKTHFDCSLTGWDILCCLQRNKMNQTE